MTSAINGTNSTSSNNNQNNVSGGLDKVLGKDDFLKLLIAQLKNQDPMSPMDDTQFVAQLTQFSTLEQMSNMASSVNSLKESMTMLYSQSLLTQGAAMIGKEAVGIDDKGNQVAGLITSVKWVDDSLKVMVGNSLVGMENIMEIREPGSIPVPPVQDSSETGTDETVPEENAGDQMPAGEETP